MVRLGPFFPKSHGRPCVDDLRVLSGIIFIRCRAQDDHDRRDLSQGAPHGLQPPGRRRRPGDQRGRLIGRTKGFEGDKNCPGDSFAREQNIKRHAVTDADGQPIRFFMTAGQVSDYSGAAALLGSLPAAEWLLGDRGRDADWFTGALKDKGIKPPYRDGSPVENPSSMTSAVASAATASRSCSAV